ncbi:MAG: HD domain-containing protein [Clostridia bacterium]|nr:HD domain-containing protein [Clostridia bacterium]
MDIRYKRIKEIVEQELHCAAHDLDHVMRVLNLAKKLAECEKAVDMEVLIPATLLHDIARAKEEEDSTGKTDHAVAGSEMAEAILQDLSYPKEIIEKIKHCIISHRYRSNYTPETIEAKILFDADKLDIMGATGIARSFILSGQHGERLYIETSIEEYEKNNTRENGRIKDVSKHSSNIEFEIKLKRIPEKLYTDKARKLAESRIKYMGIFYDTLKAEIDGKI